MKRRVKFVLLAATVLASLGSGSSLRAGEETVRSPSGKALVCFYREVAFHGNLFRYRLSDDEHPVGALPAESCLFYAVTPGPHTFQVGLLRRGSTKLRLERNHIYYLRCEPAPEVFYARPQLTLVPVAEGAAIAATLRREPDVIH